MGPSSHPPVPVMGALPMPGIRDDTRWEGDPCVVLAKLLTPHWHLESTVGHPVSTVPQCQDT